MKKYTITEQEWDKLIKDLDKKITKAESVTGNLFDDLKEIRNSFNKLKEAIND